MVTESTTSSSLVYERVERVHRWHWPGEQINVWILVMTIASAAILGIFADFIAVQQQLGLGIPWYVFCFLSLVLLLPAMKLWARPQG
jgi:hypothetical protein